MSTEVVVVEPGRNIGLLEPIIQSHEMIEYHKKVVVFIEQALEKEKDYGKIPGTNKPTLLKPGAERLCKAFGLIPKFDIMRSVEEPDKAVDWVKTKKYWDDDERAYKERETGRGTALGYFSYSVKCTLELADGRTVGEGIGACATTESKYCDRPRDCQNTALKMAKKRAHVDAVLTALGLSDRFTQDVEDGGYKKKKAKASEAKPQRTESEEGASSSESQSSETNNSSSAEIYEDKEGQQTRAVNALKAMAKASGLDENWYEPHYAAIHERLKGKLFVKTLRELAKEFKAKI